jgi:hypothetical protein
MDMIRTTLVLSCALLGAATVAASAEPMMRRAGEWEVTMNNGPMGTMTQKICFTTDKSASELSTMGNRVTKECGSPNVNLGARGVTVDATCTGPGNMKVTIHSVIAPTGPDAFHSETQMQMEGMPQGMASMTMASDARRIGPCQPGDKQMQ